MKYIRTKDNLIGESWEIASKKDNFKIRLPHKFPIELCKDKIFKEADTIEDLCDEFVLYYMDLNEQSNKDTFYPYAQYERFGNVWQKMRDEIVNKTLKSKHTLYGAIWTDKGLIYVAKMNEKGEFELL